MIECRAAKPEAAQHLNASIGGAARKRGAPFFGPTRLVDHARGLMVQRLSCVVKLRIICLHGGPASLIHRPLIGTFEAPRPALEGKFTRLFRA